MNKIRRSVLRSLSSAGALALLPVGRSAARAAPVRIGYALPLTGSAALHARTVQQQPTLLWAEQINAAGGLDVRGVRRPVQLLELDDRGEADLTAEHYLKLMTAEKVDLILSPFNSKSTYAVAGIANKYGFPLLAPTGLSRRLLERTLPYFFSLQPQYDKTMSGLVEMLLAHRIRSVGILYLDDPFGSEGLVGLQLALHGTGIEVRERRAFAPGVTDLSLALRAMKDAQCEAFIGITYRDSTVLATLQSREIGFNPRLFFVAITTAEPWYPETVGQAAQGVLGLGSWNRKSSPDARRFFQAYVNRFGTEPDRSATGYTLAGLQILQQGIQQEGLDRRALRDYIARNQFRTMAGPVRFAASENVGSAGAMGQWQGNEFEIIWPPSRATAPLVFPKPPWPDAAPSPAAVQPSS